MVVGPPSQRYPLGSHLAGAETPRAFYQLVLSDSAACGQPLVRWSAAVVRSASRFVFGGADGAGSRDGAPDAEQGAHDHVGEVVHASVEPGYTDTDR